MIFNVRRRYPSLMNEAAMSQHRTRYHFNFLFAAVTTLFCAVVSWFVMAEPSPFHVYFLWHGGLPNLFRTLHTVPLIAAYVASGNVHQPSPFVYFAAVAVQWFLAGFAFSFVFTGLPQRSNRNDRNA